MKSLMENYAHKHLITDNILQEARNSAKKELFRDADNNFRYSKAVKEAIISMENFCELLFSDRRDGFIRFELPLFERSLSDGRMTVSPPLKRVPRRSDSLSNA